MADQSSRPHRPAIPVCGIGASAGGVEALQQFFSALPADLGLAYAVIVHLSPDHKSELPAILQRWTKMPVIQVGDHDKVPLKPDQIYVIAPDRKLEITDGAVGASGFEQPPGKRAAIDLFFRSLAETYGDGFAVLLSGSGSDGAVGAKAVKERGGLILVQDPSEAAHSGIPRAAIASGVADLVLPVRELAARLAELARTKRQTVVPPDDRVSPETVAEEDERALKDVLDVVRKRTGHDFSQYKRSTMLRRLSRRMQLSHQLTVGEYLNHLRSSGAEVEALFKDLLISVTTFFRDPDAWAALQAAAIAPLVEQAAADTQIRAWVPGCATGEEAYSVAMILDEEFTRQHRPANFIVFASDVDEAALAVAREGVYPQAIGADVPESRLQRYFRPDDDHYRVASELRSHLVFAAHSVLRDPPFTRLHLISCRNLLIYLDRDLQMQVMSVFRYACRDDGTLFLGSSESASEDLFHPLDKKHRIFGIQAREDGARPILPELSNAPPARLRHGIESRSKAGKTAADSHVVALEQVAPPSVLIDERWNVVHVSPTASRFFQQSGGALARRLTDLVRTEIRDELHTLLQRAMDTQTPQLSSFVAVRFNGAAHKVAVLVQQRSQPAEGRRDVLVTFLDGGVTAVEPAAANQKPSTELVRTLREKLRQAEERIESMRDEHHLVTEDLRAANEELQSLNEEYRSTTEELETSKEEMQSINEELHTVNHELKLKLEELSRGHSDLENLMSATNVATLFLTPDLRIKRFTPQITDIFKVKLRDLDRPISDLKHSLDYDLEEDARRVLATAAPIEREVASQSGRVFIVRIGPYRTAGEREIDGVVATFFDVTALKSAEAALRTSQARLATELSVMRRLHAMTIGGAVTATMREALEHVLAAAIDLHGADFASVQLLDPGKQRLDIAASVGFSQEFLVRFAQVNSNNESAWRQALRSGQVVQIHDVSVDASDAPYRAAAEAAGYRSVQSVPLRGRAGPMLGVLSVHYREPHVFTERDLHLGVVIGRQAAELIESRAQYEHVRQLDETLRRRTAELEASQAQLSQQAADLEQQNRHGE
jgi:two-component system CheB/CheR fusion protein